MAQASKTFRDQEAERNAFSFMCSQSSMSSVKGMLTMIPSRQLELYCELRVVNHEPYFYQPC